jgi:hypothetical protein
MTRHVVISLDPASYPRHPLHADDRHWIEKNCYVDVMIEMLHALGVEPLAAMGFCTTIDFEGDNFTFFKPSHDEIRLLFGVDVQELNVWRPLVEHAAHHLADGKLISTEADAFYLPDTSGTDYRRNHAKTTIILADIDVDRRRLGYFHNAGYFTLDRDDFAGVFRLDRAADPELLPLFAELIRIDRLIQRPTGELARIARRLLADHLARRPLDNPFVRFRARFAHDLAWLQQQGLETYHVWAFATLRQAGAAAELLALHLRWLADAGEGDGLLPAADQLMHLSAAVKTFLLKVARAVSTRRPIDAASVLDDMCAAWTNAMETLERELPVVSGIPA